jgi:membrane protein implicated in regulation of membrane protease activity
MQSGRRLKPMRYVNHTPIQMKELKEFDYFKASLLFFLIVTVGGGLIGMIIGSFVAAFLRAGGMSLPQMTRILQIIGFVIATPISSITFRAVSFVLHSNHKNDMNGHKEKREKLAELTAMKTG